MLRELGEGGNARVYLVKSLDRPEEYALKTLNNRGTEKRSRFIDEIDSRLVQAEGESSGMDSGYGGRMPWDRDNYSRTRRSRWEQDDDEPEFLRGQRRLKSVVSQFMPDPKPSFSSQGYKSEPKSAPRSDSYRSEPKSSSLHEGNFKSVRAVNAARRIMGLSLIHISDPRDKRQSRMPSSA